MLCTFWLRKKSVISGEICEKKMCYFEILERVRVRWEDRNENRIRKTHPQLHKRYRVTSSFSLSFSSLSSSIHYQIKMLSKKYFSYPSIKKIHPRCYLFELWVLSNLDDKDSIWRRRRRRRRGGRGRRSWMRREKREWRPWGETDTSKMTTSILWITVTLYHIFSVTFVIFSLFFFLTLLVCCGLFFLFFIFCILCVVIKEREGAIGYFVLFLFFFLFLFLFLFFSISFT